MSDSQLQEGKIVLIYDGEEHVYVHQSQYHRSVSLASERLGHIQTRRATIAEKNDEIIKKHGEIAKKNDEIAKKNDEIAKKNDEIAEKNDEIGELERRDEDRGADLLTAQHEVSLWAHKFDRQGEKVRELEEDIQQTETLGRVFAVTLIFAGVELVVIAGLLLM